MSPAEGDEGAAAKGAEGAEGADAAAASGGPTTSAAEPPDTGWQAVAHYGLGAVLGGVAAAAVVAAVTTLIKEMLAVVSRQEVWLLITMPVVAVALSTWVLHGLGRGEARQQLRPEPPRAASSVRRSSWFGTWRRYLPHIPDAWRRFPGDVARADLTADVVNTAGTEERFPWRQAPLRALAIVLTVGLGAPMGTEAPAAHLGVATGAWLGPNSPRLRRVVRGAAVGGGAAGVSVLMGVALVGTAFMLELGRRRRVQLTPARVLAALVGGIIGWGVNTGLCLDLIRLVTPKVAPDGLQQALGTCLYVGVLAGTLTALTGWAIYRVRGWAAGPERKLVVGATAMVVATLSVLLVADRGAAVGPGGGAILWAESPAGLAAPAGVMLLMAVLRAAATTAAVAAGGCGGVFVPFLAVGDLAGRSFAPHLGISGDLAGASGAASGIAGGYRLPVTAVAMVLGIGGPAAAVTTSLGCVLVATFAGLATTLGLDRLRRTRAPTPRPASPGPA